MKRLLFITWDGPQTTYLESLFIPIFHAITEQEARYEFHVLQFTWGDAKRVEKTANKASELGIRYNSYPIYRKLIPTIGNLFTIARGIMVITDYIKQNNIDIVMPRATMPANMVNRICLNNCKLLFDADGLPIEERVDFAGLKRGGWMYNFLSKEEKKILIKADTVITRSQKAIDIHIHKIGEKYRSKFFKVTNGKDTKKFLPNLKQRTEFRKIIGIKSEEKIFVYCGSLGRQYCWDEMQAIFIRYLNITPHCRFLILTGSPEFLEGEISYEYRDKFIMKSVPAENIPEYLNIADIAFAIRKPTYSMQGVAPIKLAEYLLMGLPTIASKGIGDTKEVLQNIQGCFLYDHSDPDRIEKAVQWIFQEKPDRANISQSAKDIFSLEKSAGEYIQAIKYITK